MLAIGAHPDDVEIGCGATLAALVEAGARAGIVHLTSGEAGTRGSATIRRREAEEAASRLGVSELAFLDCGDGGLRTGRTEEDALIAVIRRLKPSLLLIPPAVDRHPDHERAHRLAKDAAFYAGLVRRSEGAPHRPGRTLGYALHQAVEPTVIVDVEATWETKMHALDAYESQLAPRDARADAGGTWVASAAFRAAIDARGRHYGALIGAAFGEPLSAHGPLALDAATLLGGSR